MRIIIILLAYMIIFGTHGISVFAAQPAGKKLEFIGTPTRDREAGMVFYKLFNRANEELALLGAPYEYENNQKAGDCIENAIDNQQQILFTGVWKKDGNVDLLDASTATCKPIIKSSDCPDKVLNQQTIEGVYNGVECGDFCYIFLKLKNNSDFSALADEEEVEKLFGNKAGKKVSITYANQMMWISENIEDTRPDAPGWCDIVPVFKTGKILGTK